MADFVKCANTTDIAQGKMKMVQIGNEKVCLANVDGKFYAIGEQCTHVGGPLSQGTLVEHTVTCPWHGSQFDITTGQVNHGPARLPEPTYDVKVEGSNILVKPRQ